MASGLKGNSFVSLFKTVCGLPCGTAAMSPWPVMITRKVGKWLKFSQLKQEMAAFLSLYSQPIFSTC